MHRRNVSLTLFLCAVPIFTVNAADLRGTVDAKVEGKPAAGLPIILQITVKNTGKEAFTYWCGGPAQYPPASQFDAIFIDPQGNQRRLTLTNGQYQAGSGGDIPVQPGESVTFPAAAEPLPPGKWLLRSIVGQERAYRVPDHAKTVTWPAMQANFDFEFQIDQHPKTATAFTDDLVRRVRAGDPFARHVGTEFKITAVINAAMLDLESENNEAASEAIQTFYQLQEFPAGTGAAIKRSMLKQLSDPDASHDRLSLLVALAAREGSDDSLDAVLAFIEHELQFANAGNRKYCLQNLFNFEQARAIAFLREKLKDPHLAFTAAVGLSRSRDSAALPVLIAVAGEKGHPDRTHALYRLSDYWDSPTALAALEKAAADPTAGEDVHGSARQALQFARDAKSRADQIKRDVRNPANPK